ncbi:ABC transporter permease subunit [Plantactinospora solaniradicis]|uniref:ABC transporter permease subunit n=1 Tax=Plantactinospora solaniradicis TaxID=1723736 RepID=A0ABW1JZH2_9ACTN
MTWLTWRQFRGQFLTALAFLAAVAAFLLYVGYTTRSTYDTNVAGCGAASGCNLHQVKTQFISQFSTVVQAPTILLMALPAIIGLFWGTPLITRELEQNTHRLVWNQSVTRTHWLAVKLALVGLASVAITGVVSLLLTWAASRYDSLQGSRFETLSFSTRNIVPLGYAVFAVALGVTIGLFLRRTVPAMAATLLAVAILQLLIPSVARGHLLPPVTESVPYNAQVKEWGGFLAVRVSEPVIVTGYAIPGALMLDSEVTMLTESGETADESTIASCADATGQGRREAAINGLLDPWETCISKLNMHIDVSYQPASRYWAFQWLEFTGFVLLAALLSAVAFWRIRRVPG